MFSLIYSRDNISCDTENSDNKRKPRRRSFLVGLFSGRANIQHGLHSEMCVTKTFGLINGRDFTVSDFFRWIRECHIAKLS